MKRPASEARYAKKVKLKKGQASEARYASWLS